MAVLFAFVVIFGKEVQAGNLPFVVLAIRFGGQSLLLLCALLVLRRPLLPARESGSRSRWPAPSATGRSRPSSSAR